MGEEERRTRNVQLLILRQRQQLESRQQSPRSQIETVTAAKAKPLYPDRLKSPRRLDRKLRAAHAAPPVDFHVHRHSVHNGCVTKLLDELAIIGPRGRHLAHVDGDELLLRVDPEIGPRIAGPHEFSGRAGNAGDAGALLVVSLSLAMISGRLRIRRVRGTSRAAASRYAQFLQPLL